MARKSRKQPMGDEAPQSVEKPLAVFRKSIKTAVYARLSVEKEDDDSIETQVLMLKNYVSEHEDLELAEVYVDNGYSGTSFDRPDFVRLMEDAKTGKIQCIVVKDLSRFGRDFLETGYYIEVLLPRLNVRLISVNDDFDSDREEDRNSIAVPIKNMVNELYAKDSSRKVSAFHEMERRTGNVKILRSIYGYSRDPVQNKMIVNPDTAPIVRMIFRWYDAGIATGEIAKRLNFMGVLTPYLYKQRIERGLQEDKEDCWNSARIRDILRRTVYLGNLTWGRRRIALYLRIPEHKTPKEEWTVCENMHEPIIEKDLFDRVQRKMDTVRDTIRPREKYLSAEEDELKGLVRCGICGKRMFYSRFVYAHRDGAYYYCKGDSKHGVHAGVQVHADRLKIQVMNQIRRLIQTAIDKKKLLDELKQKNRGVIVTRSRHRAAFLRRQIADTEKQLGTLYENRSDGILEAEDYQTLKTRVLEKKEALLLDLQEAERMQQTEERQLKAFYKLEESLEQFLDCPDFNKELIDKLVESIAATERTLEIKFKCEDVFQIADEAADADKDESL